METVTITWEERAGEGWLILSGSNLELRKHRHAEPITAGHDGGEADLFLDGEADLFLDGSEDVAGIDHDREFVHVTFNSLPDWVRTDVYKAWAGSDNPPAGRTWREWELAFGAGYDLRTACRVTKADAKGETIDEIWDNLQRAWAAQAEADLADRGAE